MIYLYPLAAFIITLGLTPVVKQVAAARGWMAHPVKDRWHQRPTALFGGIAIYAGLSVPLLVCADFGTLVPFVIKYEGTPPTPSIAAVTWIGTTFLFILGLVDDFRQIKPHTKLMGQILAAAFVVFVGYRLQWFTSLTVDTMVTLFWIVGITNAFNLLDNMDGLCSGIGAAATLFLCLVLWQAPVDAPVAALALAGALAAFLVYNFNPASIFMGDCGSLVIGFTVAVLGLYYAETADQTLAAVAVPVLVVMVPILDTTLVTLVRLLSGRKASTGGKDHTSHRLVLMGLSERAAVLFLWGIGSISGIAALYVDQTDSLTSPSVIIPLIVALLLMTIYLSQLRVYPEKEFSLLRGRTFTPVLLELTYKRQLALVILDLGLIAFCYYLSWRLRFDAEAFPYYFQVFLKSLPAVIACKFIAYFFMGVYRNIWGYVSSSEVATYVKAATLATLFSVFTVTFFYRFKDFSKGIFVIDWLLTVAAFLGTRGFFRLSGDMMKRRTLDGEAALIYGAGRGGELLLREILNNRGLKIRPIGFIDDDPLKAGKKLQGYPVLGSFANARDIIARYRVSTLLISFRTENPEKRLSLKRFCREHRLALTQFSIQVEPVDLEGE